MALTCIDSLEEILSDMKKPVRKFLLVTGGRTTQYNNMETSLLDIFGILRILSEKKQNLRRNLNEIE
jgi:hypothetical protein